MEYLLILAAYAWGCISPSYLITRAKTGIDLRRVGSGNVGGANASEQLGRRWLYIIAILDAAKGAVPILAARALALDAATTALSGVAAVIGHNWTFYLGFRGGRGMAALVGAVIAFDARLGIALVVCLVLADKFGEGPLASLLGALLLAPAAWLLQLPMEFAAACALLALVVAVKRLEANRLPLPRDSRECWRVLVRRVLWDRDVPRGEEWERRGKF